MFSLEHRSQLKIKSKNLPIFFVNLVLNSCQDLPLCPGWPESKVPNLAMQYLYTHSKHSIAFDTGRIHNLKPVSVECTKAGGYPVWPSLMQIRIGFVCLFWYWFARIVTVGAVVYHCGHRLETAFTTSQSCSHPRGSFKYDVSFSREKWRRLCTERKSKVGKVSW